MPLSPKIKQLHNTHQKIEHIKSFSKLTKVQNLVINTKTHQSIQQQKIKDCGNKNNEKQQTIGRERLKIAECQLTKTKSKWQRKQVNELW